MLDPRDLTIPQAVLAALLLAVVATMVFAATTSATAFGAFNYAWDGTTDLRTLADPGDTSVDQQVLQNTSAYDSLEGPDSLVVVLGPDREYSAAETARIRAYLDRGGTLLVGGDFGTAANALLADVGARVRVDGGLVRDERNYGRSPAFPIARTTPNASVANAETTATELALNYPSTLNGTDDPTVTVLARTSEFAYVDRNRNDGLDTAESMRTYPVISREPVGDGTVLAVSDPSLFINAMLERRDNRAFAATLFAQFETVRFDYTHAGGIPPLVRAQLFVRSTPLMTFLFGVVLIGSVVVAARAGPAIRDRIRPRRPALDDVELTEEAVVSVIEASHPDWDRERIQRIARQIVARRSGDGQDHRDERESVEWP